MLEDIEFGMRMSQKGYTNVLDPDIQGSYWNLWTLRGMMHTDLWNSAVPWTKLLQSDLGKGLPRELNVSVRGKVSVAGVGLFCLAGPFLALSPYTSVFLTCFGFGIVALANWTFLQFVRRLDGWVQSPWAMLMLTVHLFAAGLDFVLVKLRLC